MQRLSRLPGLQRLSRMSALRKWTDDIDLKNSHSTGLTTASLLWLSYACIGVIYGDIGTSPLYVYSTVFQEPPTPEDVLCAASLVFWAITLIVLGKYVFIVMLADDNGEGGTFALYATICRACGIPAINAHPMPADAEILHYHRVGPGDSASTHNSQKSTAGSSSSAAVAAAAAAADTLPVVTTTDNQIPAFDTGANPPAAAAARSGSKERRMGRIGVWLHKTLSRSLLAQRLLLGLTLVMTSMVLADGVLTPSISVLSAVSGLQVKAGLTQDAVIGITCGILVVLFAVQYRGTQDIGVLFAPIVLLWFLSNVMVAIYNIVMFEGGAIFRALSPHYIGIWFARHGREGWERLAGIFLCLTGCEAMFADMGHFTRSAVKISFGSIVYPSLIITYLGQASWLLHNADGYGAVFYNCVPEKVFWPVFVISVAAAVVASQALISGAFSIVSQSIALGCFPRLQIKHTSEKVGGQVYIPEVNYMLLVLCIAVVAGFQSGTAIGNAYGIAVNMVMLSTVLLVAIVMLIAWRTPIFWVLLFLIPYTIIEGTFLSANLLNVVHGGWFSISLAVALSCFCWLWVWGSAQKVAAVHREEFKLSDVLTYKPPSSSTATAAAAAAPVLRTQSFQLYRRSTMSPVPRNPGMALVYSASPFQVPAVFRRIVQSWGLHNLVVFVTVRQVPIPHVSAAERLLLAPLEFRGFFKCVARYGYMDIVDQGESFAQSILDKISYVVPDAAYGLVPTTTTTAAAAAVVAAAIATVPTVVGSKDAVVGCYNSNSETVDGALIAPIKSYDITVPADSQPPMAAEPAETAAAAGTVVVSITTDQPEVSKLAADAVYVLHRPMIRVKSGSGWWRAVMLERCYASLANVTSRFWQTWKLPGARLFEVGLVMEL